MTITNRDGGVVSDNVSEASSDDEAFTGFSDLNEELARGTDSGHTNPDNTQQDMDNFTSNLEALANLNVDNENVLKTDSTSVDLFGAGSGTYSSAPVLKTPRGSKNNDDEKSGENKVSFDVTPKGPKFKLFRVPIEGPPDSLCRTAKSGGATVCFNQNCSVSHRGNHGQVELKPNHAYVYRTEAKGQKTGFLQPRLNLNVLEDSLIDDLMDGGKSLDEWNFISSHTKAQANNFIGKKFKSEDLFTGKEHIAKAKNYQSPAMNKYKQSMAENDIKSTEPPAFSFIFQKDNMNEYSDDELRESLKVLDKNLVRLKAFCKQFYRLFGDDHGELMDLADASTTQIQDLQQAIGDRPSSLDESVQGPSLWSSFAILANKMNRWTEEVENISSQKLGMSAKDKQLLLDTASKVKLSLSRLSHIERNLPAISQMDQKLNRVCSQFSSINKQFSNIISVKKDVSKQTSKIRKMESFATQAAGHIKRQESEIQTLKTSWSGGFGTVSQSSIGTNFNFNDTTNEIDNSSRLSKVEAHVKDLQSNNDSEVVKFGKLNIRNVKEAVAWLNAHHPDSDFGDVVDFHCAMEHINCQITGEDILVQLHKSYRIDIQDLNQAYLMKSFERQIPRYIDNSSKHFSVDLDQSHFPEVKNYADWDKQDDGVKARLESELSYFVSSHQSMLSDRLQHDHPEMYRVAAVALAETENFINAWVTFLERTYRLYVRHRYNTKKAWYITTLLAKKIILKISEPRNNIQKSFRRGDMKQIKALTFLAMLQSLDIMKSMRSGGLENDPDVSAELVRFVSLQSDANAIEDLQLWRKQSGEDFADLKRRLATVTTTLSNTTNKLDQVKKNHDELRSTFNTLLKRVKTLEDKK